MKKLPEWTDIGKIPKKERTALQEFIYCQEPAGREQADEFRTKLKALIDEVMKKPIEDAYREGWQDGYDTTSVEGYYVDWEKSNTKKSIG